MWLWAGLVAFGTVLASLYTGPWMWIVAGRDDAGRPSRLTFVLPGRPQAASSGVPRRVLTGPLRGTRFPAPPDLVLVFTSTQQRAHDRTAADHDDRAPQAHPGTPGPPGPRVRGPARCGSFAPSSDIRCVDFPEWPQRRRRLACQRKRLGWMADERSDNSICEAATSSGSVACSPAPSSPARSSASSSTTRPAPLRPSRSSASALGIVAGGDRLLAQGARRAPWREGRA